MPDGVLTVFAIAQEKSSGLFQILAAQRVLTGPEHIRMLCAEYSIKWLSALVEYIQLRCTFLLT